MRSGSMTDKGFWEKVAAKWSMPDNYTGPKPVVLPVDITEPDEQWDEEIEDILSELGI